MYHRSNNRREPRWHRVSGFGSRCFPTVLSGRFARYKCIGRRHMSNSRVVLPVKSLIRSHCKNVVTARAHLAPGLGVHSRGETLNARQGSLPELTLFAWADGRRALMADRRSCHVEALQGWQPGLASATRWPSQGPAMRKDRGCGCWASCVSPSYPLVEVISNSALPETLLVAVY